MLRRLAVIIDNVQKECQKKMFKVKRLFVLISQCSRLELEEEKLLTILKIDSDQVKNRTNSEIHHHHKCHFEYDSFFDELVLFWKRFAHVQMDLYIRIQEKNSHKQTQNLFKKQLTIFHKCCI